ncbi:phytanoyl-CoA dioxygenase family protein [Pseudonocardia sp. CA-107938]|uniref:phytanoyl-CoA dioxygenase family protein n=1 Tax=Pseudonocardia sp. CA-107938 TaxID=3240021 RepID=UPI003D902D60
MNDRKRFAQDGFVLLRELLDPAVRAAGETALRGAVADTSGAVAFPFATDALNDIALSPSILAAIAALGLPGLPTVRASTAVLKTGGAARYDQPLHLENKEYSLVVPVDADDDRGVVALIYLTDAGTDELGPTAVVPRSATAHRDVGSDPVIPRPAPEYEVEQRIHARAGDVLLFGFNTYHRGTELAVGAERLSMQVSYSLRTTPGSTVNTPGSMSFAAWTRLTALVPRLSGDQLTCLGFPPPTDPYWTPRTVAAVEQRYPGLRLPAGNAHTSGGGRPAGSAP